MKQYIWCFLELPPACRMDKSGRSYYEIKCTRRILSSIPPALPSSTSSLDLSINEITSITDEDLLGCTALETLDISWNRLKYIQSNAFRSVENLKNLSLFHAFLDPVNINFGNLFNNLPHLVHVNIQYNFFFNKINFPVELFSNIIGQFPATLASLYTDIPPDSNFASVLVRFANLAHLGLNAKDKFKMSIVNDTFAPLKNLPIRSLSFHTNSLIKVEPMAFSWFSKLESLDLSNSSGISLNELSDA